MNAPSVPVTHASSCYGSEVEIDANSNASMSDYGSDFDATEINEDMLLVGTLDLISNSPQHSTKKSSILPSIEFEEGEIEGEIEDEEQDDLAVYKPSLLRVAKKDRRNIGNTETCRRIQSSPVRETLEVEYDERSRWAWSGTLSGLVTCTLKRLTTDSA